MTLRYIISPGTNNEKVLTEADIISHNPVRTHTGLSDLSATIIEDRSLDSNVQRQDRLNVEVNGNVKWTGYLVGLNHNIGQGNSRLRAEGIAKRLKETRPDYDSLGGSLTYSNIALEEAIKDFWSRTPFNNYSVTPQSTEVVAQDTVLQSLDSNTEFTNATSLSSTQPVYIDGGELRLAQSCFFGEAETFGSSGTVLSNSNASNGEVQQYATGGDSFTFNLDYTIPESEVGWAMRYRIASGDTQPEITLQIDNTTVETIPAGIFDGDTSLSWFDSTQWDNGDLTSGSHSVGFDINGGTGDDIIIDCIAAYDRRDTRNFDNSVDSNGYLSGPELFPASNTVDLSEVTASLNITEGTLDLTIDDKGNNQSLALSFDGGSTYTSASNKDSLTVQPSGATRTAKGRVTLSRYGSRTTATPTTGFNGQQIDLSKITVDLNDLTVIDELELSRNHFENGQQLHEYGGDWNWTIEHDSSDISNMTVKSYQEGDETRSKPDVFEDPISDNAEVQAAAYFNSIYLQGALDSGGDRPTAEEKDQTRINNDGREIAPGVLRDPKITTEAGARFKALALLETALSNNELVGEKTLPSDTLIDPGYQYPVDFGNGDVEKTLEEVSLTESPDDVSIRARFSTPRSDLSAQIEDLQRQGRDRGDNV